MQEFITHRVKHQHNVSYSQENHFHNENATFFFSQMFNDFMRVVVLFRKQNKRTVKKQTMNKLAEMCDPVTKQSLAWTASPIHLVVKNLSGSHDLI